MADANLTAVLQIRDNMSAGFQKVQQQLATVQQQFEKTNKGTAALSKQFANFKNGVNQMANSLAQLSGLARIFSLAFVINEMKSAITQSINLADSLDKMSKVMGIGVEQLQKYQFAARMANVSNSEFQASLRVLQLRAQAAVEGAGEARDAFFKLGINMAENAELADDMDRLFRLVADGLANVTTRGERYRTGQQLLGRTFAQLSPLIEGGMKKIDEYGKVLESVNGIIGKDTIESVDKFGDQLALLETMWEKLKMQFVAWIADEGLLEKFIAAMAEAIKEVVSFTSKLAIAFESMGIRIGRTLDTIISKLDAFGTLISSPLTGAGIAIDFLMPEALGGNKVKAVQDAQEHALKVYLAYEDIRRSLKDSSATADSEIAALTKAHEASLKDRLRLIDEAKNSILNALRTIKNESEKEHAGKPKPGQPKAGGEPRSKWDFLGQSIENGLKLAKEQAAAAAAPVDKLSVALQNLEQNSKEIERAFKATGDEEKRLTDTMGAHTEAAEKFLLEITKGGRTPTDAERDKYRELTLAAIEYGNALQQLPLARVAAGTMEYGRASDKLSAKLTMLRLQQDVLRKTIERGHDTTGAAAKKFYELEEAARQLERQLEKVQAEEERLIALQEKLMEMDPKWGLHEAIKQASMEFMTMKDVFLEVFKAMERGFSEAIQGLMEGGKRFRDRMRDFFKDIGNSFKKMLADMIAQQLKLQILGMGGGAPQMSMPGSPGAPGGGGGGQFTMGSFLGALPLIGGLFQPAQYAMAGKMPVQTQQAGLLSGLFSGGQGLLGLSPGMTGLLGLPFLGAAGQSDDPGKGALTGAAGGFMTGMGIGGPIGGVLGLLGGGLYGALSGSKGKREAEKAKEEQEEAIQQAEEALEEQRKKAQGLIMTHLRTTYGGGMATQAAAEDIGRLMSGGISVEELEQFGGSQAIVDRQAAIEGMAQTRIQVEGITVNATISGPYDVERLAQDLGQYLQNLGG